MSWSSVHRGDYSRMRKHLTIALLEAEALEPRVQLAFARHELDGQIAANVGLLRLMLERADKLTRKTLDQSLAENYDIYSESHFTDRGLAESA